jgi:hypothetical protein
MSLEWDWEKGIRGLWWDPFGQFTIETCIFQWIIVIFVGIIFNEMLSRIYTELTP